MASIEEIDEARRLPGLGEAGTLKELRKMYMEHIRRRNS